MTQGRDQTSLGVYFWAPKSSSDNIEVSLLWSTGQVTRLLFKANVAKNPYLTQPFSVQSRYMQQSVHMSPHHPSIISFYASGLDQQEVSRLLVQRHRAPLQVTNPSQSTLHVQKLEVCVEQSIIGTLCRPHNSHLRRSPLNNPFLPAAQDRFVSLCEDEIADKGPNAPIGANPSPPLAATTKARSSFPTKFHPLPLYSREGWFRTPT